MAKYSHAKIKVVLTPSNTDRQLSRQVSEPVIIRRYKKCYEVVYSAVLQPTARQVVHCVCRLARAIGLHTFEKSLKSKWCAEIDKVQPSSSLEVRRGDAVFQLRIGPKLIWPA
ncbi:hypothetical protein ACTXT7_005205 [Hymenolepis weldensis]